MKAMQWMAMLVTSCLGSSAGAAPPVDGRGHVPDVVGGDFEAGLAMHCQAQGADDFLVQLVGPPHEASPQAGAAIVTADAAVDIAAADRRVHVFRVLPGVAVECRFPGHRVKVRTEIEPPPFLGACNGDPRTVLSLWIDGRKVDSRAQLDGRCRSHDYKPVTYRIDAQDATRCDAVPEPWAADRVADLDGCSPLPPAAGMPVDTVEYPVAGSPPPPSAGTLLMPLRRDAVCDRVRDALAVDWQAFDPYVWNQAVRAPNGIAWKALGAVDALPGGWSFTYGATRSADFDFDNDGRIDRVFLNDIEGFGGRYWTPMLIQYGASKDAFAATDAPLHSVPCQWDPRRPALGECEDLERAAPRATRIRDTEQALPDPTGRYVDPAFYRTRYTTFEPVRLDGVTYVVTFPAYIESENLITVYRPRPDRGHDTVCAIERVRPNM